MSPTRNTIAAALLLISCIDTVTSQKVVSMPFARREDARSLDKIKRDTIDVSLGNAQRGSKGIGIYYVNTTIGTPGQTIQLQLDTGSSDLWMFSDEACDSDDVLCLGGIFDPTSSSSYELLYSGEFNISYVTPGSGVHGDYISDNVSVGGVNVKGLTMGLAKRAKQVPTGIMGIGYRENEAIYSQTGGRTSYPNLVDLMVDQSLINTRAYSLYLDDIEQATGSILFGGYDTEKFSGDLAILKIQPDENGEITAFVVAWTGFSITTSDGDMSLTTESFVQPAFLDSGTTLTVLPSQIAMQLIQAADAIYNEQADVYIVPCSKADANATLNYQFGGSDGPTIKVPFNELVLPLRSSSGQPFEANGEEYCLFGIKPAGEGDILLFGDTFLRSAYVVYDLDGQTIGLAQAITRSEKSNIVEITGPVADGLQGASSVVGQPTAQATATSRNAGIGGTFETAGASSTSSSTATSTNSTNSAVGSVPGFEWSSFLVVTGSMIMTLIGGGVFVLL